MPQEYYSINGEKIKQPLELMQFQFSTTYSADTTRTQDGILHNTPLFTVESYSYNVTGLTAEEIKRFLQLIAKGGNFSFRYYSPYYGEWRTAPFYVGQGSLKLKRVNKDLERFDSISCNFIGVNPI